MIDSFYIGAYWGSRAESLPQVRDKIIQTLQKLAEIDEQFLNWYEGGDSKKQALETKVVLNKETIEKLCLEMVKKGELDGNGFAKMGFLFGIWSGHRDGESSSITFNVGKANEFLTNACVLTFPFEGAARERLLQVEKAKRIIALLVEIWNPDYAVLTTHQLRDKLNVANKVGWITYRQSINNIPSEKNGVIHEKLNSGHLFTVPTENYDTENFLKELSQLKSHLSK